MMNLLQGKTPEQRKAISKKSVETRRKNKEIRDKKINDAVDRVLFLTDEITALEKKLSNLQTHELADRESYKLTGKTLLSEKSIVNKSNKYNSICGVYFLIKSNSVVYVGQSINVFNRISTHSKEKDFDSFAFINCERRILDKLESLYIHVLNPPENGRLYGQIIAPINLDKLLGK